MLRVIAWGWSHHTVCMQIGASILVQMSKGGLGRPASVTVRPPCTAKTAESRMQIWIADVVFPVGDQEGRAWLVCISPVVLSNCSVPVAPRALAVAGSLRHPPTIIQSTFVGTQIPLTDSMDDLNVEAACAFGRHAGPRHDTHAKTCLHDRQVPIVKISPHSTHRENTIINTRQHESRVLFGTAQSSM